MALSKGSQENYLRVLNIGGPVPTLQVWVEPGIHFPPGWAIATQGDDLIVTIRGTSNLSQWLGHLGGSWGKPYEDFPDENQYVHAMFFDVMHTYVWPSFKAVYDTRVGSWARIEISGHSYGAGLATLLRNRCIKEDVHPTPSVVTFGSPRVLTKPSVAVATMPLNVMGPKDVVTRLPPPWANLRVPARIAFQTYLGRLGPLVKFLGGQSAKIETKIPAWQHQGRRVDLNRGGQLVLAPVGDVDTNTSEGLFEVTQPADGHLMDTYYWPKLAIGSNAGPNGIPDWRSLDGVANDIIELPDREDGPTDWQALKRGVFPKVLPAYFPGPTQPSFDEFDAGEGVAMTVSSRGRQGTIGAGAQGGTAMSVWKYTARISWGKHSRSVSIHRSGPGTLDAARTDAFLWVNQYARLFGNTLAGPAKEGARFIGVPGAPVIEYVTVSDPATLRSSQRFRVPGSGGNPYKVVGTISVPADMPWVSVSLTIRATNGTNSVRDVISILGQPDGVADEGGYNPGAPCPNGFTFDTMLNGYLTYILAGGANSFGCMGRDYANAPNAPVESFITQTDGTVAVAASTANWLDQEFIKLIGTKNPYFNREWQVTLNADDTYTLKGSRAAVAGTLPSGGQGYRTRRVDGTKYQVYYTYAESLSTFNPEDRVFISERKRANPFASSRSSRRRRTPVK